VKRDILAASRGRLRRSRLGPSTARAVTVRDSSSNWWRHPVCRAGFVCYLLRRIGLRSSVDALSRSARAHRGHLRGRGRSSSPSVENASGRLPEGIYLAARNSFAADGYSEYSTTGRPSLLVAPAPPNTPWSPTTSTVRGSWSWYAPGEEAPTTLSDGHLAYLFGASTPECEGSLTNVGYLEIELVLEEKEIWDWQLETKARDDSIDHLGGEVPVFGPITSWGSAMNSGPHNAILGLHILAAQLRRRRTRSLTNARNAAGGLRRCGASDGGV
jgi:hypothetical protein